MKNNIIHIITFLLILHFGASAQKVIGPTHDSLSLENYPEKAEQILIDLENHGYPFASVSLRSADPEHGDMTPVLVIDTNLFVTFDSIVVKGNVKLSKGFLYPYLGLKRGMPYCEQTMRLVQQKLEELPFATIIQNPGISFENDKAYLYVYLDKHNTNQFDGYIGIVPIDEETGRIAVQGDLTLSLQNLFRQGEQMSLHWYSSERYSQHLNLSIRFPYLFKTRFGVGGHFFLDKQDTSYITLNYHIGIPYSFINNSYIEPYFDHSGSTILNPALLNFESDSGYIDYRKSLYGLKVHYRKLDYLFNPRKGLDLYADLSVGRRTIRKNNHVESSLYDFIDRQKNTFRLTGSASGFIPIGRHFVIAPRLQAGSLLTGPHYQNELFKIGGEGFIRGFNANDLFASTYLLYSLEFRYLFGRRSYAHLFFDGGTYEQQVSNRYLKDTPFGFGLGVNLAVKSGMFYLEYALGRQMKNPLSFKTGVIHFGIKVDF